VSKNIYTLLIVESPVLARIIQQKAPPSIYVLATGGYCWRPSFDTDNASLKSVADPEKRELRKELKEQARWAGNIIIATDPDPSGDFISWSLAKFLKNSHLKRSQIRNLSKNGIVQTVSETTVLDNSALEIQLRNQYLIRDTWKKTANMPDIYHAGLASLFCQSVPFTRFKDENSIEYHSSRPVILHGDEWISVRPDSGLLEYRVHKPLSTLDVLDFAVKASITDHFSEAQILLQQLFQTTLNYSDESLISYPRTAVNAFYSETWETLRTQYLSFGNQNQLKPIFLQEVADTDAPHESLHPLDLKLSPDKVKGELPKKVSDIYAYIYSETVKAITLPEKVNQPLVSDLNPDLFFYPTDEKSESVAESLLPAITISDLGQHLNKFNLLSHSGFGKQLDEWIEKKLLTLDKGHLKPGKTLFPLLEKSELFYQSFVRINSLKKRPSLSFETVQRVLTS
jgi:5S rRNA maturation endonuclease (ribonuclease M5)